MTTYGSDVTLLSIIILWDWLMAASLDLLQGTLDLLVLRTLTLGPMHGYSVARMIKERSASPVIELEADHTPHLSAPDDLVRAIDQLARQEVPE